MASALGAGRYCTPECEPRAELISTIGLISRAGHVQDENASWNAEAFRPSADAVPAGRYHRTTEEYDEDNLRTTGSIISAGLKG